MKLTYTSFDVQAAVTEIKDEVSSLRVNQIYDVDHKTYLIKLQKPGQKATILIESATRIHTTQYQWPKNPAPSGFSMKLRKHLRNKRLEGVKQLGMDRLVQLSFGSGEMQNHLIVELYDRGNITLTDHEYTILIILRPRTDADDTVLATHQKFPIDSFRQARPPPTKEQIETYVSEAKPNCNLKKLLNPKLDCGSGWVIHELTVAGLQNLTVGDVSKSGDLLNKLFEAACKAQNHMISPPPSGGYIIHKEEERVGFDGRPSEKILFQQEFHPFLFSQHADAPHSEYPTFCQAVDEFHQRLEEDRLQSKFVQKEKDALKKLDNVKKDHSNRIVVLQESQKQDENRGRLIELNSSLVSDAILQIRSALAHQLSWRQIEELLEEAKDKGDNVALSIKNLQLESNSFSMVLNDPFASDDEQCLLDSDEEAEGTGPTNGLPSLSVIIDLDLTAYANARKYFTSRRKAGVKADKTIAASVAALKSATRKTKDQIKENHTVHSINKVRKIHWFEKFLWFISSENFIVLAGHDQQQNELLVKKYLHSSDVYVHADLHGASSVVIKNSCKSGSEIPPATLLQAGCMALCNSRAWDQKIVTSAWWVWGHQVSKTAPSGEYLTTGSFMVRGKKNSLSHSHLVYGFGLLFRLEESSVERHANERRKNKMPGDQVTLSASDIDRTTALANTSSTVPESPESGDNMDASSEKLSDSGNVMNDADIAVESSECDENDLEADDLAFKIDKTKIEVTDGENSDIETASQENQSLKKSIEESNEISAEDEIVEFPDTVIDMKHVEGDRFSVMASTSEKTNSNKIGTNFKNQKQKESSLKNSVSEQNVVNSNDTSKNEQLKRGQRSKLKRMKNKYKNQDEEEREKRIELLQSNKPQKEPKRAAKKIKFKKAKPTVHIISVDEGIDLDEAKPPPIASAETKPKIEDNNEPNQNPLPEPEEEPEDEEEAKIGDDLAILNELTGEPVGDDELLYAIPVCAPYQALTSYKYKVKMTPGPGKKGKACKTAVSLFLAQKPQVGRECDLIRAVKDSDLARNLPGKVKVSAPNISKIGKK